MTNHSIKELIYTYYCVNRKNSIILQIVYAAENSYNSQPLFWNVTIYNQFNKKENYLPRREVFISNIVPIHNTNIRILKKEEKKYSINVETLRVNDSKTHIAKYFIYENEIIIDLLKIKVSKDLTKLDINTIIP